MLTVLLQPNPVCGDFASNADSLAALLRQVQAGLSQEQLASDPLFLTPACTLAGSPWQAMSEIGGFFERGFEAAQALATNLAKDNSALPSPKLLISLPDVEKQRFLLIHEGRTLHLECTEEGMLSLPGYQFYLPEMDEVGLFPSPQSPTPSSCPDAILMLEPQPFTAASQEMCELAGAAIAGAWELPLLMLNLCGATDDLVYPGQSCAFAADGTLLARAEAFEEGSLLIQVEDGHAQAASSSSIAPLPCWEEAVFRATTLGVRDYVRKCGFDSVVLGLSGGMDSALVATIAVEALGPEQVLAVLMPSPWSSDHSVGDSLALAAALGIETKIVPIEGMMKAFDSVLAPIFSEFPPVEGDLGAENIQARIRGVILMSFANRLRRVVLGTGNKSENAVGYCTLYGDTVGSLEPIGDIYKSDVYKIARWYNAHKGEAIIPEHILTKAPSAELRPGQKDEDSLPPYEELDRVLEEILEGGADPASVDLPGISRAVVAKATKLLAISEFKRHQTPPALRLTHCTLGSDWLMPVAAKPLPHLDD